jgi:hypothetical protein
MWSIWLLLVVVVAVQTMAGAAVQVDCLQDSQAFLLVLKFGLL